MRINQDTIKGKWQEIRGEVQKAWGKLTSDELEKTKGDAKAIAGLVRQKYGEESAEFQKKYEAIVASIQMKKDEQTEAVKNKIRNH